MAKTKTKRPTKRDRHAAPVVVTRDGELVAGKRRIVAYVEKNGPKSVAISEFHHYAMIAFLHVARDEDGKLHLATTSQCDEEGWDLVEA